MVEMTRAVWATSLGSEFDDFLSAPIDEESNGMLLSVVSALARLGVDPWQEATELAGLPGEAATTRLASLIAALPDGQSVHRDSGSIAARLIAQLPRGASSSVALGTMMINAGEATKLRTGIYLYAIFIVVMLAAQGIVASRQPPAQVDNAQALASSTVSPQTSLPRLGE